MFQYTALIYNGVSQQLVRFEGVEEAELYRHLANCYPVFVCLWHECQPLNSHTDTSALNATHKLGST